MAAFFIENFGCRATEADASALSRSLLRTGMSSVCDPALADVVVLNTCTVTHRADAQAREAIRKIHRLNPAARIVVTGCYAQRAPQELADIDGVAWVIGNSHQTEIPDLVRGMRGSGEASSGDFFPLAQLGDGALSLARGPAKILTGDIFAQSIWPFTSQPATVAEADRTRPILKIQDGCNNRCSYCVIPFVRGKSRSLPADDVIREVRSLVSAAAREIVLSGINLGSYGRDLSPRAALAGLVRRILDETALEQLRFSSIEPQDITEEFVALVGSSDRIAPHFHVPLQSGSDRILGKMHRWYRAAHYAQRIELIRRLLPHAAIGADVIVGFPGESCEDFETSQTFISRLPFTYLHVFSFSPRPGTPGAQLNDPVSAGEIRERARALRALGEQKSAAFRSLQVGRTLRALTLARSQDNWTEALTGNYLRVRIPGQHPANQWHETVVN
jgi:threonylcarbamoyladenosine tRNA methylthiotransferase MtaB